jgi:hypothetical protein
MYILHNLLFGTTDTMTSKNIDLTSWDTLYISWMKGNRTPEPSYSGSMGAFRRGGTFGREIDCVRSGMESRNIEKKVRHIGLW